MSTYTQDLNIFPLTVRTKLLMSTYTQDLNIFPLTVRTRLLMSTLHGSSLLLMPSGY